MLSYFANYRNKYSISAFYRRKRFKPLIKYLSGKSNMKILDIGGFNDSLKFLDKQILKNNRLTILNIEKIDVIHENINFILGSGTDESLFAENEFDLVISNSVIEHVSTFVLQSKLVKNIYYWGKKHFVQTPNYYFPIEPHFLFPFFQFLPIKIRAFILTKISLGTFSKEKNYVKAKEIVSSVRLLKKSDLRALFPGAKIVKEKFVFFTKSYVVHNFE